jgi:CheY-like chemotaxis protein
MSDLVNTKMNNDKPQTRTVLVVDDNVDSAESLAMLLRMSDCEVDVVYDGPSAIAAVKKNRPQLVLLDIGMPGMDGFEVARELRKEKSLDGMLLIALTGWGEDEDKKRSLDAGFDLHLVKPVEFDAIESILKHPKLP